MKIEVALTDVHGRFDKLQELIELINAKYGSHQKQLFCLGDYVDRGPESAQVVDYIRDMAQASNVYVLKGNHEQLMIDGFENGQEHLWMINGGAETVKSYQNLYGPDMVPIEAALQSDVDWMKSLPVCVETEYRIYVHAGLNPRAPDSRIPEHLMWIRDPFLMSTRDWGKHVVHGHTHTWGRKNTHEVEKLDNRTNLDTAAFYNGILSAAVFDAEKPGGPVEIIQTEKDQ